MKRGRKVAVVVGAVLGLVLLSGALLLRSDWLEGRLRRAVASRASALIGGRVEVGGLRLGLFPPGVRLRDVRVERRGNRGSEASADIPQVQVRAGLWTLLGVVRGPVRVQVEGPRASLVLAPGRPLAGGGEPLLPGPFLALVPPGSRLEVTGAELSIERPVDGRARFAQVRVKIEPLPGVPAVRGTFEFAEGSVSLAVGAWDRLSGGGSFRVAGDGVHLEGLALRADGMTLGGRGDVTLGERPEAQGALDLSADLEKLAGFLPEGTDAAGRVEARLSGTWTPGGARLAGRLEGVGLRLRGIVIDTLRGDLEIDTAVHLRGLRAHLFGGEVSGTVDIERRGDRRHAIGDLSVDGVDIAQLLEFAAWTGPRVRGTLHYRGRHEADSSGLASLRGSGVLDAVGHTTSPRGADLPLEITATLVTEGETVLLRGGTLRAASTRAGFTGKVTRADGIRLKLSGATGDISEILPLFAPPAPRKPAAAAPPPAQGSSAPGKPAAPGKPPATEDPPADPAGSGRGPARTSSVAAVRVLERGGRGPGILPAVLREAPRGARFAADPPLAAPAAAPPAAAPAPAVPAPAAPAPAAAEAATPLDRIVRALGGRWEWSGDLHYGPDGMDFQGTVRGRDLSLAETPLGALEARIRYRGEDLAIEAASLRLPEGGSIELGGRVDFRGAGSISVEATAENYPIAPFLTVAAIPLPIEGSFSGSVLLSGRPEAPSGRATVRAEPVTVLGVAFDSLEGDLLFTPDLIESERFILAQGPGVITFAGGLPYQEGDWLPPEGGAPPGLEVVGDGLDLAFWSGLIGGAPLAGAARLRGRVTGSVSRPRGSVSLQAEDVRINGSDLGGIEAEAEFEETAVRLRAAVPARRVSLEGRIDLREPRRLDVRGVLDGTAFAGREVFRGSPEDVRVVLTGEVAIAGPLSGLRALEARADLAGVAIEVGDIEIRAADPVVVRLAAGRIELPAVRFQGAGTEIDLSAAIAPEASGPVRVEARGRFDLRLLRVLAGDLQASGHGEIVMQIGGTLLEPVWQGSLTAEAQAIRHPDVPFPLSDLRGRAVFENSSLRIETLEFLAGGGPVTGSGTLVLGTAEAPGEAGLPAGASAGAGVPAGAAGGGAEPARAWPFRVRHAEVRFRGRDVRAEFPEGFRSVSDVEVALVRDDSETILSGTVDIVRGIYRQDFRLEDTITRRRPADFFGVEAPPGPLQRVRLDLAIRAPGDVWIRNDFGSIEGEVEVLVTGTLGRPSVGGRITAQEGGTIQFRQVRYRVVSGTIDFADPQEIRPSFDLLADTRVSDYQVTLHLEGTLDDFRYELSSDPALPQSDIVALLLTGRTLGSFTGGGTAAEETVSAYVAGRLTGELTERLGGRTGLDLMIIDPLQVNAGGDPTTRVTLGKRVTPDLFVTYSSELGSNQGSIYQLDYTLARDFSFSSQRDTDGSIGGDFKFFLRGRPPAPPGGDPTRLQPPAIGAVRLEGDLRYPERRIRRKLRVRRGRPRDRAEVNAGVDRVWQFYRDHGYLMADIDAEERPAGPQAVDLVVSVRTGPRVTLRYEGDRVREATRREVAGAFEGGLFLEDVLDAARDILTDAFGDRGYLAAAIEPAVSHHDPERLDVLFKVRRGPRIQAGSVRVAGASLLRERQVLRVVRTSEDSLFSRGIVRRDRLEEDTRAIRELYLQKGFPAVKVEEARVSLDEAGARARVVFPVEEGPLVTIAGVAFEGHEAFPTERLLKLAALKPGTPYTASAVDEAIVRLRRAYDAIGYPDAEIADRQPALMRGGVSSEEEVRFVIREGPRQIVRDIDIAGNVLTRDKVIRKSLTVRPGGWLSRGEMLKSQTRLYRRGIFRSVSVDRAPAGGDATGGQPAAEGALSAVASPAAAPPAPEPPAREPADDAPPPGAVPRTVEVEVREAAPVTQLFGIGYDSEARVRGLYEVTNRNLLGRGRSVSLQTRASDIEQRGALSFREPGVFGGRFDALATAFVEIEERPAFEVRTIGSSVQLGRQVSRATRLLYRYSLRDVDLSDATAVFEGSTLRLSNLAVSAVHDTRDALFDPTRGHYLSGELQWFGDGIGSEAQFTKLYAQIYLFRQVAPRTVWAQALRAGVAVPSGRSLDDPASTGDALSGIPPSERFFAGGDTSVRGFRRDRLGPLDVDGTPLGGEGVFLFNQELRFPIWRFLQGAVFYDTGNVYRTRDDYDLGDLRHVAGAGLRFATPIGPFRLEYGWILDREPGEERGELFLSIGQAF